jgi:hypothetical protein
VVWNYGATNEQIDLLVNTVGTYDGTRPLDWESGQQTAKLQIKASGQWKITVSPLAAARREQVPSTVSGEGDDVVVLVPATGEIDTLKIDATKAQRNFILYGWGTTSDLLANEIAPYSGTVLVAASLPANGNLLLDIRATGEWSIEVTTR